MKILIDERLHSLVAAGYPVATHILNVQSYRPNYLPYPARVTVAPPDAPPAQCVVKSSEQVEAITFEARVLRALAELGLVVPQVLVGPVVWHGEEQPQAAMLLSELPGDPLPWLRITALADADLACRLVAVAVDTLHNLSAVVRNHAIANVLPHITLLEELEMVLKLGGPCRSVPVVVDAVELLQALLPTITTPLVFSNGDYNPLNFLHTYETVTGWLDFEYACFEDPYIGFAKFLLWADDDYGWGAGAKAGLVERYLYAHNLSQREFLPRLILRGLRYLQGRGEAYDTQQEQAYMLNVLVEGVARLKELSV